MYHKSQCKLFDPSNNRYPHGLLRNKMYLKQIEMEGMPKELKSAKLLATLIYTQIYYNSIVYWRSTWLIRDKLPWNFRIDIKRLSSFLKYFIESVFVSNTTEHADTPRAWRSLLRVPVSLQSLWTLRGR